MYNLVITDRADELIDERVSYLNLWRKVRAYENINIQWRATQREYMAADFGCKEVYP